MTHWYSNAYHDFEGKYMFWHFLWHRHRQWLVSEQATNHYLNQCRPSLIISNHRTRPALIFQFSGFWSKLAISIFSFVLYNLYTQPWWPNACFPWGNSNILLLATCEGKSVSELSQHKKKKDWINSFKAKCCLMLLMPYSLVFLCPGYGIMASCLISTNTLHELRVK